MTNDEKRKSIQKYYAKFPTWAVICIIIGVVAFSFSVVVALVLIGAGAAGLYFALGGKATDQEIDKYWAEDLAETSKVALGKVGLDQSELVAESLQITGPILWGTNGVRSEELCWKKGADNRIRFSVQRVTVILFTENQIACYSCDYNSIRGVALNEATDEYFYKDVVSVSTKTESSNLSLPNGVRLESSQYFALTTSGGTAVRVLVSDPRLAELTQGDIPTQSVDKAINAVRAMLRQKKA